MSWSYLIPLLMAAASVAAGPIYTLTDLGTLGGSSAQANALNASGLAVGSATNIFGIAQAFSSTGAGMIDLGDGMAGGVNSLGQIAGTASVDGQNFATVWNNGVAHQVGGAGSYGLAINDSGQVAGMLTTADGAGHAFVTNNGSATDLGALPGGTWSSAYAINGAGQVAGYGVSGGVFRGFVWSPITGYQVLGTLGGGNSYAMGINDSGQVAGTAQIANGYTRAFLSNDGQMQNLGTLGGAFSFGYGVNDLGNVVGFSSLAGSGDPRAFLYEGGVMYDLNSLLIGGADWTITQAYAINGSNQIVGSGMFDGVEHAVLLTSQVRSSPGTSTTFSDVVATPEPAAWIVTLTGLVGLCLLRKRHNWSVRGRLAFAGVTARQDASPQFPAPTISTRAFRRVDFGQSKR